MLAASTLNPNYDQEHPMSEAVRAVALAEANKLKGDSGDSVIVLKAATEFLNFLQGGATGPATRTAAGTEPDKKAEAKPSANTAGAKTPDAKKTAAATAKALKEAATAKAALEKANAEEGSEEATGPTEPFEADAEGVSAAVAAMIANKTGEGPDRDRAIALLKHYKAASVSAMQKKDEAALTEFIDTVNSEFGLSGGSEPDLES